MPILGSKVEEFTSKSGKNIIFRYIHEDDAEELCRYINEISKEDTFIRFSGETVSIEDEKTYLDSQIIMLQANDSVSVVAMFQNEIIGYTSVDRNFIDKKRGLHIATMGLSVSQNFRDDGVGRRLMSVAIQQAKQHITALKIISLDVFSSNTNALELYRSLGFIEYGRLPGGIFFHGEYVDEIRMYLKV